MQITKEAVRRAVRENRPVAVLEEDVEIPTPPLGWKFLLAREQRGTHRVLISVPTNVENSRYWRECKRQIIAETCGLDFSIQYVSLANDSKVSFKWYQPVYEAVYWLVKNYWLDELYSLSPSVIASKFALRRKEPATTIALAKAFLEKQQHKQW